ncbi:MAG: PilZ domain-containing protein [Terriglobales bacterium]
MSNPFSEDPTISTDRISPRHVFEARIQVRLVRSGKSVTLQGWARDLSESGLAAFVADVLGLGDLVILEIPLATSAMQTIPAKVIRALGTEYGFQFTALSAEQRKQIRSTLLGHPTIPYRGPAE